MLSKQKKFVLKMKMKNFFRNVFRNWYWIVILLLAGLIFWGLAIYYYVQPSTKWSCKQRDGDWLGCKGQDCLECYLPKEDAGKSCSNDSECGGSCVATNDSINECDKLISAAYKTDRTVVDHLDRFNCPAKGTCSKYDLRKGDNSLRVNNDKIDFSTGLSY